MPRGRRVRLIAAGIGGALVGLTLPRVGFWPFGWFGLAPLFFGVDAARSKRETTGLGFAAGFAYHGVVLNWVYATCRFAHIPVVIAALAWAGLAAVLAVNWALVALLGGWLNAAAPRPAQPWIWALAWTAVAAATSWWTPRLATDVLAYTQWPNHALIQAGSWGGPHALGFVIVLFNAALVEAWLDAPPHASTKRSLAAVLAIVCALWAHGTFVLRQRPSHPGTTARVEILQPNVDQYHKWDMAYVREILNGFDELLSRPGAAPAIVVWPETSIPLWTSRGAAAPTVVHWALSQRAFHLVGVVARPDAGLGPTNGVQLVAPDGRVAGYYAKRELVPFGEYVPLRRLIPRVVIDQWLQVLDNFGDLSAGPARPPLLQTPFGPTAATICYEAMFPRWARGDAARGAKLLVNVTNDGWYKDTWGPYQHFGSNIFRAIENRIPVIRSGNTGISAVIDPWGVVTAQLPLGARGRLDADVPTTDFFPRRSFYSRHGDWLGTVCLAMTVLLCVARILTAV